MRPTGSLAARKAADLLVVGYQNSLSLFVLPSCRYLPSCSAYARAALQRYGVFKGGWLLLRRLMRCHPWAPGGFDPLP